MTNRWTWAPSWIWFGGESDDIASLWNKRKFSGDFSMQFYFAFKEGVYGPGSAWSEHPANVGFSFCADGLNLGSGYSLVLGADGNRHTILMKQGHIVAESSAPEALFPSFADGRPFPSYGGGFGAARSTIKEANMPEGNKTVEKKEAATATGVSSNGKSVTISRRRVYGQTHWWYAKVNKIGNRIECWLDENLLFAYDDPEPLSNGQMALWTFNNGILLSRVQIYYENEIKRSFIKKSENSEPIAPVTLSEPLPDGIVTPLN
jgi:hypothetical protein